MATPHVQVVIAEGRQPSEGVSSQTIHFPRRQCWIFHTTSSWCTSGSNLRPWKFRPWWKVRRPWVQISSASAFRQLVVENEEFLPVDSKLHRRIPTLHRRTQTIHRCSCILGTQKVTGFTRRCCYNGSITVLHRRLLDTAAWVSKHTQHMLSWEEVFQIIERYPEYQQVLELCNLISAVPLSCVKNILTSSSFLILWKTKWTLKKIHFSCFSKCWSYAILISVVLSTD